ncbi:phospholipase D-like domain-containing protein [Chengkuizengella axinellae]|uniref:phospholipase D n=1 Tax=Chengkuizengella axinellae TaxID=3064388 RepID=A0ABT9J3N2_9BACL|nr:phospholipase D-like domain-containing protein [Chengkuizengella sp. 2205SS18-9]MDP5276168.1 phospholipase D-like domain-containing protein [Chengkuizengella sp. 2205SS18-9]
MRKFILFPLVLSLLFSMYFPQITTINAAEGKVVINEIAWMGTNVSSNDEWIELYNNTNSSITLEGWVLVSTDGTPNIQLSGTIPANDYFLLERTDDSTVSNIAADMIYTGALSNTSENLELRDENNNLVDTVNSWYAGDNSTKATMERIDSNAGSVASNWSTSNVVYNGGFGTPKQINSNLDVNSCSTTEEQINNISNEPGAINLYFNKCALEEYASFQNQANYNVNLEDRLIERLNEATTSIDMAAYEINLPRVVDTLIMKASEGIDIRFIADSKDADDPSYIERFEIMRLYVEKMVRGLDGIIGTSDDIQVFSDSPIFVVEDATKRIEYGLPSDYSDIPLVTVQVGSSNQSGHIFVYAEQKGIDAYYSPNTQMHNKFVIIDDQWMFTGSWNFTVTGLYGTDENMANGILDGNQQHVVEVNNSELASIYETEFNEMWGSNTLTPNQENSNFNTRKSDNTPHSVNINGTVIEVYFSSGDNALGRVKDIIQNESNYSTYFTIFAWSDQSILDELKFKWEGSYSDLQGTLTGFDVKGVFDSSYWNLWWSASVDMTGRTASQSSEGNPNIRWANPAPVYKDNETRKLHSKTMLIDADTTSDPTVIIGSTNWSENGNNVNDENMLIIHNAEITNQFLQEFNARYQSAGGDIN